MGSRQWFFSVTIACCLLPAAIRVMAEEPFVIGSISAYGSDRAQDLYRWSGGADLQRIKKTVLSSFQVNFVGGVPRTYYSAIGGYGAESVRFSAAQRSEITQQVFQEFVKSMRQQGVEVMKPGAGYLPFIPGKTNRELDQKEAGLTVKLKADSSMRVSWVLGVTPEGRPVVVLERLDVRMYKNPEPSLWDLTAPSGSARVTGGGTVESYRAVIASDPQVANPATFSVQRYRLKLSETLGFMLGRLGTVFKS